MVRSFQQFISDNTLFPPGSKILLTVSGGIDSVVMAHLFHKTGVHIGIAHCNFQLRNKDSQADEQFVRHFAESLNAPFFLKKFNTREEAKKEGISIQMAARKLRYEWFETIRSENHFDFIATAHHLDDQIETFFINLIRGTGISGLHGIFPKKDKIIRPMLFACRNEIETYALNQSIAWREDRTNNKTKYLRNKIRIDLIPAMKLLNPDFLKGITATIGQIRSIEKYWKKEVDKKKRALIRETGNEIRINLKNVFKLTPLQPIIWELLAPYGFNEQVIHDLLESFPGESGRVFYSKSKRLITNRDEWIITPRPGPDPEEDTIKNQPGKRLSEYTIKQEETILNQPIRLKLTLRDMDEDFDIPASPDIACLDVTRFTFPLTIRRWRPGDAFYPLGMTKKKKLSDFFIDNKFSLPEKENCWLLTSDKHILWIIGHRIDHRFRITKRTKRMLQIELTKFA